MIHSGQLHSTERPVTDPSPVNVQVFNGICSHYSFKLRIAVLVGLLHETHPINMPSVLSAPSNDTLHPTDVKMLYKV